MVRSCGVNVYRFGGDFSRLVRNVVLCCAVSIFPAAEVLAQEGFSSRIEEIIVTSRRRAESLLDTPQAISAITADQMQEQGIHDVDDVTQYVPNVTLTSHGRANNTRIVIRGIGGGFPDPVFPFGAGMYIDYHYIPGSTGGYMSTLDIERIEVLRGPQGTLFGKNVTGGAVNIITAKPDAEYESSLTARLAEHGQKDLRGMINVPFSDNFYGRFSASRDQYDGYYYNQNLGIDSGFAETTSARAAFRYEPNDQLILDFVAGFSRQRDDNNGGQCIGYGDLNDAPQWGGGTGNLERRLYTGAEADFVALCAADMAAGEFVNSSDHVTFSDVDEEVFNLGLEWDAADPGSWNSFGVKAKVGHRYREYTYLADRDYVSWPVDTIGTVGGKGINSESTSFELLFEGEVNDRFQFTAGFNLFDDTQLTGADNCFDQYTAAIESDPSASITCTPVDGTFFELVPDNADGAGALWPEAPRINGGGPGPFFQNVSVFNDSRALFAHGTYQINDDWKLDFGGRYTEDDREFNNIEFSTSCDLPDTLTGEDYHCEDGIIPVISADTISFFNEGAATFSAFTPMISLTRNVETGIVYGLFSEGFLTGGFNTELNSVALATLDLLSYDPEEVLNYELGYKGRLMNDSVEISSAIFYMDYKNKQDVQEVDNSEGILGADDTVQITQNVSSASIKGIELEVRAVPWDGGYVTFDLGYLDNEYSDYSYVDPISGDIVDLSDALIHDYTPDWKANLAFDHEYQLDSGATLIPRLNLHWESEYDFGAGHGWTESDPSSSCTRDSYLKADARVSYEPADGGWQLVVFGNNLTDERILEFCDTNRSVWRTRLERPRHFGLEFTIQLGN